jgi:hypothetical protein
MMSSNSSTTPGPLGSAAAPAPSSALDTFHRAAHGAIHLKTVSDDATFLRIMGVNYVHIRTADEGDMYVTEYGLPLIEHLKPENWYEEQWFKSKRERLAGTSAVYRVPSQPIAGRLRPSIDLVVKWSRVGQDVPLDTFTLHKTINAEFNTPFEEFSLVEELRQGNYGPRSVRILMQRPLAIYAPPKRMQAWQTGRSKDKILAKIARHPGVEIDILRSYILLYQWIRGLNAVEAYRASYFDDAHQQELLSQMTEKVDEELHHKGFMVADNKPSHFIVRLRSGDIKKRRDGALLYAMIDYELLARTPAHEEAVKAKGRSRYLTMQRDRFDPKQLPLPAHLKASDVLGVPYVYGRSESTNGALWVVGRDAELFGYFLPERWRTRQIRLSNTNQTYYTQTKDRIHLVWKVSRVGELPACDESDPRFDRLLMQGFNSPFEEFQLALALRLKGVNTVYPRAIYMTGQQTELSGQILDDRRFRRYQQLLTPEGTPTLRMDRDYITIWGYWRGLEDTDAPTDSGYWTPIDAAGAYNKGIITSKQLEEIIERQRLTLAQAGFEDVSLRGDHILLSYIPEGGIKKDKSGQIELRQCNFELVRRLAQGP